jgi:2-polyprenyl-3-methyl-5-hydroxy-6-metoxy-1,4-benzoquinol methylase
MLKTNISIIDKHYNKKALKYGISKQRLNNILKLIKNIHHQRILDIGCATGYLGNILKKNNNYVVGFDISKSAIKNAKKILHKAYQLNIETDKFPYLEKFDLIILSEVIEHLFQPQLTLKRIIKLLKPNGLLLITTPNFLYWGNRILFLKGNFSYSNQGIFDESHLHFFTDKSLKKIMIQNNLKIIAQNHLTISSITKYFSYFFPGLFAYQLIYLTKKIDE